MFQRIRVRLTYANVMATVGVFIALGGTTYAATTGSIDSREIKNNTIRGKDIRRGAVKSSDVKNGALLQRDFKRGELPAGAAGPPGATGPAGPRGLRGLRGLQGTNGTNGTNGATNVTVRTGDSSPGFTAGGTKQPARTCDPGERALSGGVYTYNNGDFSNVSIANLVPTGGNSPTGYQAFVNTAVNDPDAVARVVVICAAP